MSVNSKIEWCDSTFNPWIGCTKVGPGCDNCYAEAHFDHRVHRVQWGAGNARSRTNAVTWSAPLRWNNDRFAVCDACGLRSYPFERCPHCKAVDSWSAVRRRVFCASLADVFDNEVDREWRDDLATLILNTPNLDWLLLTKRIGNAGAMLGEMFMDGPPDNIRIGATIVNQEEADRDIPKLLRLRCPNFLSMEPLLGPVDLTNVAPQNGYACNTLEGYVLDFGVPMYDLIWKIDWVIAGGESGPRARPSQPDWFRSLRDQCAKANVPFLFKQWGEWVSVSEIAGPGDHHHFNDGSTVRRTGKKTAGRLLDGVEHNGYPEARS